MKARSVLGKVVDQVLEHLVADGDQVRVRTASARAAMLAKRELRKEGIRRGLDLRFVPDEEDRHVFGVWRRGTMEPRKRLVELLPQ